MTSVAPPGCVDSITVPNVMGFLSEGHPPPRPAVEADVWARRGNHFLALDYRPTASSRSNQETEIIARFNGLKIPLDTYYLLIQMMYKFIFRVVIHPGRPPLPVAVSPPRPPPPGSTSAGGEAGATGDGLARGCSTAAATGGDERGRIRADAGGSAEAATRGDGRGRRGTGTGRPLQVTGGDERGRIRADAGGSAEAATRGDGRGRRGTGTLAFDLRQACLMPRLFRMKQLAPKMASNLLMQFCSGLISEGCYRTLVLILHHGQDEAYSAAEGPRGENQIESCCILLAAARLGDGGIWRGETEASRRRIDRHRR
ncbi:uncharacterized protein LOC124664800 [Lolium rigidum]|uniref:uncharacterized protein LOC124664800 n=1 Tax=Lolium rigidum TaxID=89674 RepID=UPI001F5E23DC|nr:uncharacterized protein LOC124664800 [Lolium rigidum]